MRDSNRSTSRGRGRTLASILVASLFVTACGSTPASPTPAPSQAAATPSPTPDPHLVAPVALEAVYTALQKAGLKINADTAGVGKPGAEPTRQLVATYEGWPLIISQYSSTKALDQAKKWKKGKRPGQGEPPLAIKGLNILVEWGPTTGRRPPEPDARQLAAIDALVTALDPLLYPLSDRAIVKVDVPVHTPIPAASPAA